MHRLSPIALLGALALAAPASSSGQAPLARPVARSDGAPLPIPQTSHRTPLDGRIRRVFWHGYFRHHRECLTPACARAADRAYAHRRPTSTAGASWFDDAGGTACGFTVKLGVAHKTLPCHTRVRLCAHRCAIVEVEDRGPFVPGRAWDLNPGAKAAIGFGDTGSVRYRILH